MLRFISGRAASGKTYTILGMLQDCVISGKKTILLVPEQFSFESEKAVLDRLGDKGAQAVSVISFTRLCDEVERLTGGICGRTLTEPDKLILMGKAVLLCADRLSVWRNYGRSSGFASAMLDTVNEFKQNAITPEDLRLAAEETDGTLSDKLMDTAEIYFTFNTLVAERFIDPSDRLDSLYRRLEDCRYFDNKTVFIDSFKGFTGQQYKILDRIFAQAENVTVSLTDDPCDNQDTELFYSIRKTKRRLSKIAASHHIKEGATITLYKNHYKNAALSAVEKLMAEDRTEDCFSTDAVTVCQAVTVYDEAEFVARNIRRLVREGRCRYRDIVVIARDTAPYEQALEAACVKNGVSCFIDRRIPLGTLPPAASVLAAADAARGFTTERILRFHKTGLDVINPAELSRLENYTYLWNISGKDWLKDWDMDPDGFNATGALSDKSKQTLDELNALRKKAITPLMRFKDAFRDDAKKMSKAIYELLCECDARGSLLKLSDCYKNDNRTVYADAVKQSWDMLMQVLDSLAVCFGEGRTTAVEYTDALHTALKFTTVGVIPQMLDEVTFGAADRIRPSRPKYAFIIGANQGVFPKTSTVSGIFGNGERSKIIELGIDITDRITEAAFEEEFLVYSNVCCPTDGLFISYCTEIGDASAFVENITTSLDCVCVKEPAELSDTNLPETSEAAFSELCRKFSSECADAKTLGLALSDDEDIQHRIDAVICARAPHTERISEDTAKKLFGSNIKMSPSRLEEFNRCRFMYFCKSGLRAKKLQPADFDAMQRGTLIHFVLQKLIEKYGKGIAELDEAAISREVDMFIDEYLDSVAGYRSVETPRSRYLVSTMARSIKFVANRLALEFAQSEFEPQFCELRIGDGGDIPEIKVPAGDDRFITLSGIVDRLDSWNGYIRIVDYKTGHRDFKLPDILVGQNMQMLIYLYALCRSEKFGGKPAGIFYMPARRVRDDRASEARMSGIMQADISLVEAMEKENRGHFVPRLGKTPSDSFIEGDDFDRIFSHIDRVLSRTANSIMSGDIAVDPVDGIGSDACKYCDFRCVCRIGDRPHRSAEKLSNAEVVEKIVKDGEEDGV